ncbi:AaceriADR327Wp [[Ashbya] aceris (nom. inval.)]|nr:AaceriADR327Wp [[Ashbya] aceris (nom. inval.)]
MLFSTLVSTAALIGGATAATVNGACVLTGNNLNKVAEVKKCTNIVIKDFTVPAGKALDLYGLRDGTTVTFAGKVTMDYAKWAGPVFLLGGKDITVTGAPNHVLEGNGQKWWNGAGDPKNEKPKFMRFKMTGKSVVEKLNVHNTPKMAFSVNNCHGLTVRNNVFDNRAGDGKAKNTDAFDVGSSTNILIQNNKIWNQDDCLAVNSGSGVRFLNNFCSGGHGISIGSVGHNKGDSVTDFLAQDNQVVESDNGLRIKTFVGAVGKVDNIKFINNKLKNIRKFAIVIEGDYHAGTTTGTPTGGCPITNLEMRGNTGNAVGKGSKLKILVKNASKWTFANNNIAGNTFPGCSGAPNGIKC